MLRSACRMIHEFLVNFSLIFGDAIPNVGHCEINRKYGMTGPQYTNRFSRSCECCARSMDDNANIHNEKRLIPKYVWRTEISRHNHIRIMHTLCTQLFVRLRLHVFNIFAHTHARIHASVCARTPAHAASEVIILFFLGTA